ncbi:MAG: DUF2067 domain-containing protein [Asgard group archaeon]|nr:DUF2067 domain-containing protein [Asgard group archaeon]
MELLVARWTSKELVLGIETTQEAIIFLEAIQKQIKIVDIYADYQAGKVTIKLEGTKDNLKDALDITQNIYLFVKDMLYPDKDEYFTFNIGFLSKISGKTFPVKTLLRILTLQDHDPSQVNGAIKTRMDYETLLALIGQLNQIFSEMPYEVATSSLRDVLVTIVLIKNITITDAIKLAKKKKIIAEDDLNRLKLSFEPEQAIEKCLKPTK